MLEMFDFAVTQLRYIKGAATEIPSFRPDGLAPTAIQAIITAAAPIRLTYLSERQNISDARVERRTYIEELHEGCVSFTAQALNRFRNDPMALERIQKLPVMDRTLQETLVRADAILALWPKLPNVGSPLAQFKYGQGIEDITLAIFTDMRDLAASTDAALPDIDQNYQDAEADMHRKLEEMQDLAQAAIADGKSRYAEGTSEREIIDAIPNNPPSVPPAKATIDSITLSGPLAITLTYDADGGTSFDILQRIFESGVEYLPIAEDIIEKTHTATGLAPATTYEYIVRPRNSRGTGPTSDPATLPTP